MRRFAEKEGAQEGVRLVWRSGSRARRVSARQWSFVILFPLFDPQFQLQSQRERCGRSFRLR